MIQANGPGHLERDGHVSHKRRAKASASPKAAPRGRSLTTLGALSGPAMSDISLAQTAGLSDRTTAASITKAGVTSGNVTMTPSSPFLESGKRGHDVVSDSSQSCEASTDTRRAGLKSRINWYVVAGLAWAISTFSLTVYVIWSLVTYPWGG